MARKKMKRSSRPRRYRKRAGNRRKTININRALQPFSQRYICKLKYSDAFASSVTSGVPYFYRFRLNSLYDPDLTGVGHQPYGYDQLTPNPYNRYRVISCHYRIGIISGTEIIQAAALPTNSTHTFTSVNEMIESPRCKYILQNPQAPVKWITGKVNIPSLFGRNKAQYMADDNYQALYNANPVEQAILQLGLADIGNSAANFNFAMNIQLTYTVELFDIQQFNQS